MKIKFYNNFFYLSSIRLCGKRLKKKDNFSNIILPTKSDQDVKGNTHQAEYLFWNKWKFDKNKLSLLEKNACLRKEDAKY